MSGLRWAVSIAAPPPPRKPSRLAASVLGLALWPRRHEAELALARDAAQGAAGRIGGLELAVRSAGVFASHRGAAVGALARPLIFHGRRRRSPRASAS